MGGCCIGLCCIMDFCGSDCCVGNCANKPSNISPLFGSIKDTNKVAKELKDKKEEMKKNAKEFEKKTMDNLTKSVESLIDELEKINKQDFGGYKLSIDIEAIRRKNDELKKDTVGFIGKIIDKRLITEDQELSIILDERDDKKRKANFNNFCQKVYEDAQNKLKIKLEKNVEMNNENLRKEISARISEIETEISNRERLLDQQIGEKEKEINEEEESTQETKMEAVYSLMLCRCIMKEVEEAKK